MSDGLMLDNGLLFSSSVAESTTTPSITKIGWFVAFSELIPRMRMEVDAPGVPELACICTPAARPCNTWSMEVGTDFLMAASFTDTTEPVRSERFICP